MNALKSFLLRWWNKEPRPPLNLFLPDVAAEVAIHVLATGERKMFMSKLPPNITKEDVGKIAIAVIQSGMDFAAQYGVQIQAEQRP